MSFFLGFLSGDADAPLNLAAQSDAMIGKDCCWRICFSPQNFYLLIHSGHLTTSFPIGNSTFLLTCSVVKFSTLKQQQIFFSFNATIFSSSNNTIMSGFRVLDLVKPFSPFLPEVIAPERKFNSNSV